jgi:hypothetical protein
VFSSPIVGIFNARFVGIFSAGQHSVVKVS